MLAIEYYTKHYYAKHFQALHIIIYIYHVHHLVKMKL